MSGIINLYDLSPSGLGSLMASHGEKTFRARQLYRQLYVNRTSTLEAMSDLPAGLRDQLASSCSIGNLQLDDLHLGDDGLTRKATFRLPEGDVVETVLMVYADRATVCVSSQAGCAMQCVFCATGKMGFQRNLTSGQMIEQVLWATRELPAAIAHNPAINPPGLTNVVYMGMGEPFHNYDAWWESVERLHDPEGYNMGARSFTVSTVGLVPGIRRLAGASLPINLAVSLHAPNDALRTELMPVNKAYDLDKLLHAIRDYATTTHRRVSFEYVLLSHQNDTPELAAELAALLRNSPVKDIPQLVHVNLIPWNPVPGTPLSRSSRQRVLEFQAVLHDRGVPCTVRVERGVDIGAACGQLAGAADATG